MSTVLTSSKPLTSTYMDPNDLQGLKNLSKANLRQIWDNRLARKNPPKAKKVMIRELAWQTQSSAYGGINAQTITLLRSAVRRVKSRSAGSTKKKPSSRRSRKSFQLQTGTRLVRIWRGVRHEVTVLYDGKRFEYNDNTYRNLTKIALAITGTHWSGPRFFGLHKVGAIR